VPQPGNPQALNRYSYTLNNPLKYKDSTGHFWETAWDLANIAWDINEVRNDPSPENIAALVVDMGAAALPFVPGGVGMVVRGSKTARSAIETAGLAENAAQKGRVLEQVTSRAVGESYDFVLKAANASESRVATEGLEGSIQLAKQSAGEGTERLPGLFRYGSDTIDGYAQHHLWPRAMGGPVEGWVVYARNNHTAAGGLQDRLNVFLREQLGKSQRELETWARENPSELLPHLRRFYEQQGIPFPY
jgi:hypothetical protein